jgi:hypothetical protein
MEGSGAIPELLAEHARLVDEKARLRASNQTPSTKINYDLTKLVHEIVDRARAERSDDVRSLLAEHAGEGNGGAENALEWLAEEDPWWTGRGD